MAETTTNDINDLLDELKETYGPSEAHGTPSPSQPATPEPERAASKGILWAFKNLNPWIIGLVYALALIGATVFSFTIEDARRWWVAGAVWATGWPLARHILTRKGYTGQINQVDSALERLEVMEGCGVLVLAPLAIVGPFVLLATLVIGPRDLAERGSSAAASAGEREKNASAPEGQRPRFPR